MGSSRMYLRHKKEDMRRKARLAVGDYVVGASWIPMCSSVVTHRSACLLLMSAKANDLKVVTRDMWNDWINKFTSDFFCTRARPKLWEHLGHPMQFAKTTRLKKIIKSTGDAPWRSTKRRVFYPSLEDPDLWMKMVQLWWLWLHRNLCWLFNCCIKKSTSSSWWVIKEIQLKKLRRASKFFLGSNLSNIENNNKTSQEKHALECIRNFEATHCSIRLALLHAPTKHHKELNYLAIFKSWACSSVSISHRSLWLTLGLWIHRHNLRDCLSFSLYLWYQRK